MKYLIRIILVILLAGILVFGAMHVPVIMNKYNENKFVDRVEYVERKDVALFGANQELKINEKIKYLGYLLSNDEKPQLIEIPYEPNIKQIEEFENKIGEELGNWPCINKASIQGLNINVQDIFIKDIKVYSIYDSENITYFFIQAFCGDLRVDLYMDSKEFKIYHVTLRGNKVTKWIDSNNSKGNELWMNISTTNNFSQAVEKYYNLAYIRGSNAVENSVTYSLDEGIDCGFYILNNQEFNIGLVGFEDDFSANIVQYSISTSESE